MVTAKIEMSSRVQVPVGGLGDCEEAAAGFQSSAFQGQAAGGAVQVGELEGPGVCADGSARGITGDFNDGTVDKSIQEILNGPGDKMIDTLEGLPAKQRKPNPANPAKLGKFTSAQFDHILIPESMKHRLVDSEVLDMHELTANASDHKPLRARFSLDDGGAGLAAYFFS